MAMQAGPADARPWFVPADTPRPWFVPADTPRPWFLDHTPGNATPEAPKQEESQPTPPALGVTPSPIDATSITPPPPRKSRITEIRINHLPDLQDPAPGVVRKTRVAGCNVVWPAAAVTEPDKPPEPTPIARPAAAWPDLGPNDAAPKTGRKKKDLRPLYWAAGACACLLTALPVLGVAIYFWAPSWQVSSKPAGRPVDPDPASVVTIAPAPKAIETPADNDRMGKFDWNNPEPTRPKGAKTGPKLPEPKPEPRVEKAPEPAPENKPPRDKPADVPKPRKGPAIPLALDPPPLKGEKPPAAPKNADACFGTKINFVKDPSDAARKALAENKLLVVFTISGNFEDSKFT